MAAAAVCPAEISAPGFSLSEYILRPPRGPAMFPGKIPEELPSHGTGARKEMRHPTQGPHRGDDTRASWPVSINRVQRSCISLNFDDLAARSKLCHPTHMKKPRKPKKRPAKKRKPQLDVNQLAFKLVQSTIRQTEK